MAKEMARFLHRPPFARPHPQDHVSIVWLLSRQGYQQLFVNNQESISVYQNDARKQSLEGASCIFLLKIQQREKIIWFLFCRKVD